MTRADENYEAEKAKINTLEKICFNEGLEPVFFNLSEYMKSGAMLSCMMMHLNYVDYNKSYYNGSIFRRLVRRRSCRSYQN